MQHRQNDEPLLPLIQIIMKKAVLIAIIAVLLPLGTAWAQQPQITEGMVFELVKPNGDFQHLQLPRKNFILKQGGHINMQSLNGNHVVVEKVQQLGEQHKVVLRRKDGGKFLRVYPTLTAHWPQALQDGELRLIN
jgi:hypothetical protein